MHAYQPTLQLAVYPDRGPIATEPAYVGWTAVRDDSYDGPGSPIGHGRTREEAITSLLEHEYDRDLIQNPPCRTVGCARATHEPLDGSVHPYCASCEADLLHRAFGAH